MSPMGWHWCVARANGNAENLNGDINMPDEAMLTQLSIDSIKVEKLVREFLTAQTLSILPQNYFGDAVSQFVDKDDKFAMETFVAQSLSKQMENLLKGGVAAEDDITSAMGSFKSKLDELFASGRLKNSQRARFKPKPAHWDSDLDGSWEDQPGALELAGKDDPSDDGDAEGSMQLPNASSRGRGTKAKAAAPRKTTTRKAPASKAKAPARKSAMMVDEELPEEQDDIIMIDDDEDEEAPPPSRRTGAASKPTQTLKRPTRSAAKSSRDSGLQTRLNFSQNATQSRTSGRSQAVQELVRYSFNCVQIRANC